MTLKDFPAVLFHRLVGKAQSESADEKGAENCRQLQTGLQENPSCSPGNEETIRKTALQKKSTVVIMVAAPADLQQVGYKDKDQHEDGNILYRFQVKCIILLQVQLSLVVMFSFQHKTSLSVLFFTLQS